MPKLFSRFLWLAGLGAAVGGFLATWLSPKMIAWYFSPPVDFGINCRAPIEWALRRFQWAQFSGLCLGALTGIILGLLLKKRSPAIEPPRVV